MLEIIYGMGVIITAIIWVMGVAGFFVFTAVVDSLDLDDLIDIGMPSFFIGIFVSFGWPLALVALIGAAIVYPFAKVYRDKEKNR